jgi:hypothetical protein
VRDVEVPKQYMVKRIIGKGSIHKGKDFMGVTGEWLNGGLSY